MSTVAVVTMVLVLDRETCTALGWALTAKPTTTHTPEESSTSTSYRHRAELMR